MHIPVWDIDPSAPSWVHEALSSVAIASGRFSGVFALNEHEVVKLVWEAGARDYLRMCESARGYLPHFPRVAASAQGAVTHRGSGCQYSAFRMERLHPGGPEAERLAERFTLVTGYGAAGDKRLEPSVRALETFADELAAEPKWRALSSCLLFLGDESRARGWFADLGDSSNWMLRADGSIVLSDPVHGLDADAN